MSGNKPLLPTLYIKAEKVQLLKSKYSFSVENNVREYINQILQHFVVAGYGCLGITHWRNTLILVNLSQGALLTQLHFNLSNSRLSVSASAVKYPPTKLSRGLQNKTKENKTDLFLSGRDVVVQFHFSEPAPVEVTISEALTCFTP